MIFKRRKIKTGIFDDLPQAPEDVEIKPREVKKTGRRAMLVPETPYRDDLPADQLLENTGKQKEAWLKLIFDSEVSELRQIAIATYLQENYRVQKWWANSIALMYLKWRNESKTAAENEKVLRFVFEIPTEVGLTYNLLTATAIYGEDFNRFLKTIQDEKIIITFKDETRATILLRASQTGCSVILEHEFIANPVVRKLRTKFWQELFERLIEQVSR